MKRADFGFQRLTEAEIAEKVQRDIRAENASVEAAQAAALARVASLRGVPFRRFQDVTPKPWAGGLLFGQAGTGKTREAIARLLSTSAGVFVEALELVELARDVELDRAKAFTAERFALLFSAEFLVVDDLGSRRATEFAVEAVYRVVAHRWDRMLETLVTSNLDPTAIGEAWGERTMSRISAFGKIEKFSGRDWRKP